MEPSIFRYILRSSAPQQMCRQIILAYTHSSTFVDLRLTVNRATGDPVDRTFAAPVLETISSLIWISSLRSRSCELFRLELMTSRLQQAVVRSF